MSNVFGYVLPVEQLAELAISMGFLPGRCGPIRREPPGFLKKAGAEFIAMPGHKGAARASGYRAAAVCPGPGTADASEGPGACLSSRTCRISCRTGGGGDGECPRNLRPGCRYGPYPARRPQGHWGPGGAEMERAVRGSTVWAFGFLQARIRQACCLFCRRTETAKRLPVALPPGDCPAGWVTLCTDGP